MVNYKKILLLFCFVCTAMTVVSKTSDISFPSLSVEQDDKTMTLRLLINATSSIKMENVPTVGYLEVYSLLGVKVKSVNLKNCIGEYPLDLPKGLYILKAGKVATKVIVR
ncbi:T9SS type A sorting domain-containing protein [Dysgonomonas sp. BGC7]|nr:T9SS type A sorting domain-containing protein [Dysgonomonas sp. BGC7]